ncbi:MAG: hypothetical protein H7Z20_07820 [Bdellovibrio sp.]|nr:hypothetical protein [Methylotenera sp.]
MKKSHLIFLVMLVSLLSLLTALTIFLAFDYFTIGLIKDAEDLPIAGMQIWDIHKLLVVLIMATLVMGLVLFIGQKILKKTISNSGLVRLTGATFVLAIVFFPNPFEFQIRHYNGPAEATYIVFSGDSGDFIDDNEDIFMGKRIKNSTAQITKLLPNGEIDYTLASDLYDCVEEKAYWFGHISVVHSFLPILDKKNGDVLIKKTCKPTIAIIQ